MILYDPMFLRSLHGSFSIAHSPPSPSPSHVMSHVTHYVTHHVQQAGSDYVQVAHV